MGHLSARLSANCQRQTAYLLLAEMSQAPINPWKRNKCDPVGRREGLHAKIGELTLENDFLEGALSKAGLLNARR